MSETAPTESKKRTRLGVTAAICAVFVAGMVGMAFAAVPLYKMLCQLTGYGGTTRQASRAPDAAIDRTVTIRFDANISNDLGWSFRPEKREVTIRVGEVAEVAFLAENRSDKANTGVATFNVSPGEVGAYFDKIACFCFSAQTLAAGQAERMPVVFFVDPAIVEDHELDQIDTITLSYAFLPAPAEAAPKPVAALSAARGSAL